MNELKQQVSQLIDIVNNMDLQGKKHLVNYKLKDILTDEIPIKVCIRCGKKFVPPYNARCQKYCCDDCRYNSTKLSRKYHTSNSITKPIEMLAKRIHQKRYYYRTHNIKLENEDKLQQLLEELIILRKQIKNISKEELDNRLAVYEKLYYIYTNNL